LPPLPVAGVVVRPAIHQLPANDVVVEPVIQSRISTLHNSSLPLYS